MLLRIHDERHFDVAVVEVGIVSVERDDRDECKIDKVCAELCDNVAFPAGLLLFELVITAALALRTLLAPQFGGCPLVADALGVPSSGSAMNTTDPSQLESDMTPCTEPSQKSH